MDFFSLRKKNLMGKFFKGIFYAAFVLAFAAFLFAGFVFYEIGSYEVCENPKNAPEMEYALLLGSIKYLKNGHLNMYYQSRIETAARLYKLGKFIASLRQKNSCDKNRFS